jgi:hypothetical protein
MHTVLTSAVGILGVEAHIGIRLEDVDWQK